MIFFKGLCQLLAFGCVISFIIQAAKRLIMDGERM